jgi:RNA-binding protein YlmH
MKINRESYISHIKDIDKQILMRKLIDKIEISKNKHTIEYTDFLDPYERYLAKSILNRFDELKYIEYGGTSNSERRIIIIYPFYYDKSDIDPRLSYLRITGDIQDLSHKDFLGALLGLGINRSKVGDIQVHCTYTDIILKDELGDFLLINLNKVSNKKISVSEISQNDLEDPSVEFKEINKFITSLRLDAILSITYNISRQDSINMIKSGKVKVNWEEITKPSKELDLEDVISTKGYGRAILHSIDGMSKKGRLLITVRILI